MVAYAGQPSGSLWYAVPYTQNWKAICKNGDSERLCSRNGNFHGWVRQVDYSLTVYYICLRLTLWSSSILYSGHLAMAAFFVSVLIALFYELVSVRYKKAKEAKMPLFRTLQWAWFAVALFYAYGASFLKADIGMSNYLKVRSPCNM